MRQTRASIPVVVTVGFCAAVGAACSTTPAADVAYEDAYASDYYYPADLAAAPVYGVGWGYGLYASVIPTGLTARAAAALDGGALGAAGAGGTGGAAGFAGTTGGAGGTATGGSSGSGSTTVHSAVGEAIRLLLSGASVCAGHVTMSPGDSGPASVCGIHRNGVTLTFSSCQLASGGTVDGTVTVGMNVTASDSTCTSATTLSIGYTSTLSNLTYTGNGGGKLVIPSQTDMATIHSALGQTPATITMMSSGEIQRVAGDGTMTSDRTFTGSRTFSSISFADQSYTVDGTINVTDKTDGSTGTMSATGLMRERTCCKPTGGSLTVSRTGGNHAGSHTWMYSATCGSATLDGKTVTLPACL